jgi:hypothetical protein
MRDINSGDAVSLAQAELIEEAANRTGGLVDFGAGPVLKPLALLLDSLEREAQLNPLGRMIARERVLGHLSNHLLYVDDRKKYPAIGAEKIVKPVFIIGMPRTGTTSLHDILGQDPGNRVPTTWECMFPSPPPERKTFLTDPRIERCEAMFPAIDALLPGFKAMHPMGALLSQECVTLMADTLCSPLFHNQFRVPSYENWVDHSADWFHVYEFHEQQLQHMQWRCAGQRWVLKTGAHMWGLEHLLAKYPDARIVFTQRDPVKSLTSYASLTTLVRSMGSAAVDRFEIARDWSPRVLRAINHTLDVRDAKQYPHAKIYDMPFDDFVDDQFAQIEKIYAALDIEMTDVGAAAMQRFIDDNPPGKHGVHSYTAAQYGIDPVQVRRDFARYIERFDLAPAQYRAGAALYCYRYDDYLFLFYKRLFIL